MKHRGGPSRAKFGSIGLWLAISATASACAVATEPTYQGDLSASAGQPVSNTGDGGAGGTSVVAGGTTGSAGSMSRAGSTSTGAAGSASGGSQAGGAASSSAGSSSNAGTSSSSGGVSGTAATGSGGASGGGAPSGGSHGLGDPWTFDSSLQGWAVRDHSANITTLPTATGGVASFVGLPFSMASEYSDFALSFGSDANLSGLTLHAKIRRVSGGFVGAQVYAYGGAWSGGTFTSLNSASFQDVTLIVPSAGGGFDPTQVSRIGIKLNTGSNASNAFSATTIEVDEVTIE